MNTLSPVAAVEVSENSKLGMMSATYVSQATCGSCVWKKSGCYAESGFVGFTTHRINKSEILDPISIAKIEAEKISDLTGSLDLRLHVVGDSPTNEGTKLIAKAAKNYENKKKHKKVKVFGYTHQWRDVKRSSWVGVSMLASCESTTDVKNARRKGYATAIVVSEFPNNNKMFEKDGIKIIPCLNQTMKMTCVDCRLCLNDKMLKEKKLTIGFKTHGVSKNKMNLKLIQIG